MSKLKNHFRNFVESQVSPLELTEEEEAFYMKFGMYVHGEHGAFDISKGLFIRGNVGVGKTMLFRLAQRYSGTINKFYFINALTLESNFEEGYNMEKYYSKEWCFDDMGTEQKANKYGKGIEVFKRLIEHRYDLWKYHGTRTHFTSNCNNDELISRYGDRAYDRLKEMCCTVKYPASQSKRNIGIVNIHERLKPKECVQRDFEAEFRALNKKNSQSIKRMIKVAYSAYFEKRKKNGLFLLKECYQFLSQNKIIDFGGVEQEIEIKKKAIEQAKKDKTHSIIDSRQIMKRMEAYNPIFDAMVITVFFYFDHIIGLGISIDEFNNIIDDLPEYKPDDYDIKLSKILNKNE